jgi:uncharacterized protein YbjT (DUF2867 family)
MRIAVAGATGSVGRHIVEVLKAGGHDVVPMSRASGVRIEGLSNPDDPDRALYEAGAQLPGPDAILGGPTFQAWLEGAR